MSARASTGTPHGLGTWWWPRRTRPTRPATSRSAPNTWCWGCSAETLREAATATLPPAVDELPALTPFDAQSKKALELTFREALRLGHNYVGTEHLLLALLELENGTGPLTSLGVDKAAAEAFIGKDLAAILATRQQQ